MQTSSFLSISIEEEIFIGTEITGLLAFGAGVLSFLSPCTLPLLPVYLSYITGKSVKEVKENNSKEFRRNLIAHSIFFLIGVSAVYISLGLGVSYLGSSLTSIMSGPKAVLLQRLAGIFMIVLGFVVGGWVNIPILLADNRKQVAKKSTSYLSSMFIGLGFAAGWTPCIGPIFSGILLLGISTGTTPILFLMLYVIGFALPFLVASMFIGRMNNILKHSQKLMKIGGVMMIIMGLLMATGQLAYLSEKLSILLINTPFAKLG